MEAVLIPRPGATSPIDEWKLVAEFEHLHVCGSKRPTKRLANEGGDHVVNQRPFNHD
jgi:hypothetical protein